MRDIIFRGKCKDTHEWVMGGYCEEADSGRTHIAFWNSFGLGFLDFKEVYPKSVGQYTGLKDKNGTKIFEHDIIRCYTGRICKVTFFISPAHSGFDLEPIACFDMPAPRRGYLFKYAEVIGNIHDNPELLED